MNRRLALITGGYFIVIGMVAVAVLPFAVNVLHVETTISNRLDPAQTSARMLLAAALDQETGVRGYLVTPEPSFLQPHESGRQLEAEAIRQLEALDLRGDDKRRLRVIKQVREPSPVRHAHRTTLRARA